MTGKPRSRFPLQLPVSLKDTAMRLARQDGVSLNQWIVSAVAQKIGAVETAEDFLRGIIYESAIFCLNPLPKMTISECQERG
ncbi:MAG: hypothetical protein OXM58_07315 [Rhodospirillaceae bacterium]|nr:hypothetical protein [Rhodospirillaceae bacterium]